MASFKYRSKKTGKVATYAHRMPRLERDKRYEGVEDKPAGKAKQKPADTK